MHEFSKEKEELCLTKETKESSKKLSGTSGTLLLGLVICRALAFLLLSSCSLAFFSNASRLSFAFFSRASLLLKLVLYF